MKGKSKWHTVDVVERDAQVRAVEAVVFVGLFALALAVLAGCVGQGEVEVDGHKLSVSRSSSPPAQGASSLPSGPGATSQASGPPPSPRQNPVFDANGNPVGGS